MQETPKHTANQPDEFSRIIRQKLESHELLVDASCWAEIEARLGGKKKKRIVPFWWWTMAGGAVAAMFALLLTLPTGRQTTEFANKASVNNKKTIATNVPDIPTQETASSEPVKVTDKPNQTRKQMLAFNPEKSKEENTPQATQAVKQSLRSSSGNTLLAGKSISTKENIQTTAAGSRNLRNSSDSVGATSKKKVTIETLADKETQTEQHEPNTKKDHWLLAAAFGSGGNISGGNPGNLRTANYDYKSLSSANTEFSNIMAPNDFSEKNYMAPLSFGLMVRKNLSKTLGLESGLTYTYLQSTFRKNEFINYNASLNLHYLGVPLNLIVRIWNSPQWELYASCGPMVEKGLRSVYTQKQETSNQLITTKAATSIDGLQWSLNAGVGISYRLQRDISFYFEPKFSYFFDNNQPVSIRTEQPAAIGLSAGIRYQFR